MTKKLNKFKEIVSSKKKKAIEATAGKFQVTSNANGSLISQQNGLRSGSDADLQNKIGGELEQQQKLPRTAENMCWNRVIQNGPFRAEWILSGVVGMSGNAVECQAFGVTRYSSTWFMRVKVFKSKPKMKGTNLSNDL